VSDIQDRVASILNAQDVAWCDKCDTYKRIDEHIEHVAEILVSELQLTCHDKLDTLLPPTATEFWHTWAMPWVRTCICLPDDHDIANGGLRDDCPIHGDRR
jgi:hypothetical protein